MLSASSLHSLILAYNLWKWDDPGHNHLSWRYVQACILEINHSINNVLMQIQQKLWCQVSAWVSETWQFAIKEVDKNQVSNNISQQVFLVQQSYKGLWQRVNITLMKGLCHSDEGLRAGNVSFAIFLWWKLEPYCINLCDTQFSNGWDWNLKLLNANYLENNIWTQHTQMHIQNPKFDISLHRLKQIILYCLQ